MLRRRKKCCAGESSPWLVFMWKVSGTGRRRRRFGFLGMWEDGDGMEHLGRMVKGCAGGRRNCFFVIVHRGDFVLDIEIYDH